MLPRFSVKKPYTVLVAAVLAILLGFVSFFGMTTDLLPALELPYVLVITTCPGAAPERVEQTVTQPLEAALGTAGGLASISSVSQESASMIILEFEQSTNMDAAMIDLSTSIDLVEGSFDDTVGSPMLLRISPDMLPVMVASVDLEGAGAGTLSDLVEDTVSPAFERLEGVGSVSASGLIEREVHVTLSPEKIDALSARLADAARAELEDARAGLEDADARLAEGRTGLENADKALDSQFASGAGQMAAASAEVDAAVASLASLTAEEQSIAGERAALEAEQAARQAVIDQYNALEERLCALGGLSLPGLGAIPAEGVLRWMVSLGQETFEQTLLPALSALSPELAGGLSWQTVSLLEEQHAAAADRLAQIEGSLADLSTREMAAKAARPALEAALEKAKSGYEALESGKLTAAVGAAAGKAAIADAKGQLESAAAELESARESLESAAAAIGEQTDLSGVLTAEMVSGMLMAQNFSMPAGYLSDGAGDRIAVRVSGSYEDLDALADTLLFEIEEGEIGPVRLRDIAEIGQSRERSGGWAKVNGNDAVMLSFQKQSTASTSEVAKSLGEEIEALEAANPGLHITPLMDQGQYIGIVTDSVLSNLATGGLLAVAVLVLFLRDLRPTLVIACSIPISLMCAVTLMYFTGVTLNLISLSGLALGVGMLVDNSIVVIENIYRLRAEGMEPRRAAVEGAKEVQGAILASTLTTVCVFLPIVFTEGLSRQLFTDMGLTIAYSLLASLAVALTLVPALGAGVLRRAPGGGGKWLGRMIDGYERTLRWALGHRAAVLAGAGGLLALAVFGASVMGTAFLPKMESSQMTATLTLPEGACEADQEAAADRALAAMGQVEGVETVGATAGGSMAGLSLSGGSDGTLSLYLMLSEENRRPAFEIAAELEQAAAGAGCAASVSESAMDLSALGGSGIEIELRGQDLDAMRQTAAELAGMLGEVEGLEEISDGAEESERQLRITVDRDAAAREGLTAATIYSQLAAALSEGTTATTLTDAEGDWPVIVASGESLTRDALEQFELTGTAASSGSALGGTGMDLSALGGTSQEAAEEEEPPVTLGQVAAITEAEGPASIRREAGARVMSVTASVLEGYNVGLLGREIEGKLANYQPPEGIEAALRGENETISSAMWDLVKMIALAVAFIYLIMVAQFQSLLSPFIVLFTLPLAFTGGLLLLWACGMELSVIAMLGFLVLAGVVVNNGIVFVDYANTLRGRGIERREALVRTGRDRIRPILMTALTTVLAMVTMALGIGDGAEMTQPMAVVTIGGLSYATLLTLFVVPVMYDLLAKKPPLSQEI